MKLSVVIVNYNVKHYLEQCLHSLYRSSGDWQMEIVVVDNASADNSEAYITERFPQVVYVRNEVNQGFARACNQGIRLSHAEYVLLLNPDTVLAEDTLCRVINFMDAHPEAGAAGVKMLDAEGHLLPESKRGYPTLCATLGKLTRLGHVFPNSKRLNAYYKNELDANAVHRVEILAGAFMMLRRSALDKCGLLDEDFFMYGEDIDLSCRLLSAGFYNYYLPYPILHYKGESTQPDTYRHLRVFYGAMSLFYRKHAGHGWWKRWLVEAGVATLLGIKMGGLYFRRLGKKFFPVGDSENPRCLVFATEEHIYSLRALFKRNGLDGRHHYVVSDAGSTELGHGCRIAETEGYTHVVYDCSVFPYARMLALMEANAGSCSFSLGIYHPKERILITSEHIYV